MQYLKKSTWKIVAAGVFIFLVSLPLMYLLISAPYTSKIHYFMSPKTVAVFNPPRGKEVDTMFVWVGVVKESTHGSFTMAIVGYETYYTNLTLCEYHWYTDNPAGEDYAYLFTKVYPTFNGTPIEHEYDVTSARFNVEASEHQLNATITVNDKTLLTVRYSSDTDAPLQSRVEPSPLPQQLYLSVEVYRPMLTATVTGVETGEFTQGRYEYLDTELIDTSLLQ